MRRKGFTLVEMVIVVAIILIITAILFPVLRRPEKSRSGICSSNLKSIAAGVALYATDNDGKLPHRGVDGNVAWLVSIHPYVASLEDLNIFECPTTSPSSSGTTDYFINARVEGKRNKISYPANTILFGDGMSGSPPDYSLGDLPSAWRETGESPARRHGERANYAFVDGHVAREQPKRVTRTGEGGSKAFFVIR